MFENRENRPQGMDNSLKINILAFYLCGGGYTFAYKLKYQGLMSSLKVGLDFAKSTKVMSFSSFIPFPF